MRITLANYTYLSDVPDPLYEDLVRTLTLVNPRWMENERLGRWNGKTPRLLKYYRKLRQNGIRVPRGYSRQLIYACRRHGIDYEIADHRRCLPEVDFTFTGRLKPFQETAVAAMGAKDFGTLAAPTGSGKTVMALSLIARRRQPALVVVHTKELAQQWLDRIEAWFGIPREEIGLIGGGKERRGERITVALVQSLYRRAKEIAKHTGYLVVDECHHAPSRTFTDAVTAFDSRYMLGLSATPWRRDKLSKLIFWHLGDVHHEVDQAGLVRTGDVLKPEIVWRETDFRPYYDAVREYSKMLTELTSDQKRNHLIAADVAAEARQGAGVNLVLSDRKIHCETLRAILRYRHHVDAELLTGDVAPARRKEVVERLNAGRVKVLIATGQLIGEGFDCPGLSTLFLATPIRFGGRVQQYLGRVLRPAPDKRAARVYDYTDIHVDVLMAAARSRRKIYGC